MKSGLVHWQTTVVGALLAGALVVQSYLENGDVSITDSQVIVAVLVAVLSWLQSDANKTQTKPPYGS